MSDHAPSAVEVPTIVSGSTPAPAAAEPVAPSPIDTPTIITPSSAPVEPAAPVSHETPAAPDTTPAAPEGGEPKPAEGGEKPAETPTDKPADKPAQHTDKPTLLEITEGDKKPDGEGKPAEGEKKPETVETAKYEPFTLPEGLTADEPTIAKFSEIVGGPEKLNQETAQKLVDLYSERMGAFAQHLASEQHRIFAETRAVWVETIKADPILGGAGHQTALQAAARMRDLLVPEEHRAEFADFMRVTGAGDHPAMFRLLHNAARLFDEPAAPPIPAVPVPDRGGSAKPSRSRVLYDHPSSVRAAQQR